MKTNKIKFSRIFAAWVGLVVFALLPGATAFADGTEILGPYCQVDDGSNSYRCMGDGIVSAGTGMIEDNEGTIEFTVPAAATVEAALLYWVGYNATGTTTDGDTITFEGAPIQGTLIGGPINIRPNRPVFDQTYRADITGSVTAGFNSFVVEDMGFNFSSPPDLNLVNHGAGILVIYSDGSGSWVDLRDGDDYAFFARDGALKVTEEQTFIFPSADFDRIANLSMFFSGVEGSASGGGQRPNLIKITVGATELILEDPLNSADGDEWDTYNRAVPIPAGETQLSVVAISDELDGTSNPNEPASFTWHTVGLSIALPSTDCLSLEKTCVVDPPEASSGKCKGKLQEFTVIWNGDSDIDVTHNGASQSVMPGVPTTFFQTDGNNDQFVQIDGLGESVFHMSCSDDDFNDPSDCGKPAGDSKGKTGFINDWSLDGWVDANGDILNCGAGAGGDQFPVAQSCDITLVRETPSKCKGKLRQFTVSWNGPEAVDVTHNGATQSVAPGALTTFFVTNGQNNQYVSIDGFGQSVFHTSCSDTDFNDPSDCGKLAGDGKKNKTKYTNNWTLEGFVDANDKVMDCSVGGGTANSGALVTYGYKVTNDGNVKVEGIQVSDDQLGTIGGAFDLEAGESKQLTESTTLFATTTNIGFASATGLDRCQAESLPVTVTATFVDGDPGKKSKKSKKKKSKKAKKSKKSKKAKKGKKKNKKGKKGKKNKKK